MYRENTSYEPRNAQDYQKFKERPRINSPSQFPEGMYFSTSRFEATE